MGLALVVVVGAGCAGRGPGPVAGPEGGARGAARGFTVLAINDVYRIEGVDGGTEGGPARVRVLREELEAAGEDVLLLHAGDLLYPSLFSRKYDGEQMIDVLNLLDGRPGGFDGRLFVTFGNHEFDEARLEHAAKLTRRIVESEFAWLGTNLIFGDDDAGRPRVAAENLTDSALLDLGGVRVGLFSITTDMKVPAYIDCVRSPLGTARRSTRELRQRGAEFVIGLTHLYLQEDLAVLETLGADGPDLIIGGHEHDAQAAERGGRWVLKADADARSATVARVAAGAGGGWEVRHEVRPLAGSSPPPDAAIEARVEWWKARLDQEYCVEQLGLQLGCLDEPVGRTRTRLEAEEIKIRKYETNLGNWAADLALDEFAGQGAQAAFVNSGSLRLNQDLPADSVIARRHIEELFAYSAELRLLKIDGATLQKVVSHAIENWTGNGWWLQIAGFAYRHDPEAETATGLTLLSEGTPRPIRPDEELLVVTTDFLVDPSGGQDGYTMLGPDQLIAEGADLKDLVVEALRLAGDEGIAPTVEGRICNPQKPAPCLALEP